MKKLPKVLLIVCMVLAIGLCTYGVWKSGVGAVFSSGNGVEASSVAASSVSQPEPEPTVTTLHFSATGDNLIHDGLFIQANRRAGGSGYNFDALYENVQDFYKQYDINWINQETLLSDDYAPSGYPMFCTPTAMGQTLYNLGFRVISMSNNHSYDKGAGGMASTLAFWGTMPSDIVTTGLWKGSDDYGTIPIQEVGGIKIAYLAYTEHTNGLPTPADAATNVIYTTETDVIQQQITLANSLADVVVVGVHMGVEGSHETTDAQREWFQNVADWGADIVIGTHPHVIQDMAWLTTADGRNVPVAYCLGNFANLQSTADTMIGVIMTLDINVTTQPDGTVSDISIENLHAVPTVMHYDSGYTNGRVYLFADYSDELAAAHGVRSNFPGFSMDYIRSVLTENINADFLVI